MATPGELRFQLLGRFGVEYRGERVRGFRCRRTQELFARLLLDRCRVHRREALAGQIWSDDDAGDPRRRLRQALWQSQSTLSKAHPDLKGLIRQLGTEWLRIDPEARIEIDVIELQWASDLTARGNVAIPPAQLQRVEAALELYRGEFLDGVFSDWCILERERYNEIYVCLLERLMALCQGRGDYRAGIEYGIKVLREDRARERTHRRLMRLYYLAGDRVGALRQFDRCVEALRLGLDVAPSRRTLALERQVRRDEPDRPADSEPLRAALDEAEALLERLVELQKHLGEARREVDAQIGQVRKIVHTHG